MPRLSSGELLSRRSILAGAAFAAAGAALPGGPVSAARTAIRMSDAGPGTAGAIWRPLIDAGLVKAPPELDLSWVLGNPGQVQLQLSAGVVDVSAYGAIGVAEIAPRGTDIVIFAPLTNNHGRWIVRGESRYRAPRDLIGKKIATQPESSDTYRHARLASLLSGFDLKKDFEVIFGPPTANLALLSRGDVDAVITIEPTATRLIAQGAREIARVGDMWREATGDAAPLLLIGQAGHRAWVEGNKAAVDGLRELTIELHRRIKAKPELLAQYHRAYGIPDSERAAIELLPRRMLDVYSSEWGPAVFANIERQINEALKAGIIAARPSKPVYVAGNSTGTAP
jgi:ABC-type nitrate/sulfonate/bicarbonate transport system substrate-binding protein